MCTYACVRVHACVCAHMYVATLFLNLVYVSIHETYTTAIILCITYVRIYAAT